MAVTSACQYRDGLGECNNPVRWHTFGPILDGSITSPAPLIVRCCDEHLVPMLRVETRRFAVTVLPVQS
jgi:hypothetical protein